MRVELRNVKYAAFASEETNCFEATLVLDGKPSGRVRNEGRGGCNFYDDAAAELRLAEYAKTLPPIVSNIRDASEPSGFFTYQPDADSIVGDLLSEWLVTRDYRRAVKSRVLFTKADGKVYETSKLAPDRMAKVLANPTQALRGAVKVLNLLPESEALTIYRANAQ